MGMTTAPAATGNPDVGLFLHVPCIPQVVYFAKHSGPPSEQDKNGSTTSINKRHSKAAGRMPKKNNRKNATSVVTQASFRENLRDKSKYYETCCTKKNLFERIYRLFYTVPFARCFCKKEIR